MIGNALFQEYEDVVGRDALFREAAITRAERNTLLDAVLSVCEWVPIYYLWRPNLPDESDNHLVELAIAGGAAFIVTANKRDLKGGELNFPHLRVATAGAYMKQWSET